MDITHREVITNRYTTDVAVDEYEYLLFWLQTLKFCVETVPPQRANLSTSQRIFLGNFIKNLKASEA